MSFLVPDYDYDPQNTAFMDDEKVVTREPTGSLSKEELSKSVREYANSITDANLHRFYGHTAVGMRNTVNPFDSVSFFKKFCVGYIASLRKTFPEINSEQINELQKLLEQIEKIVAVLLKSGNVENKYLLTLTLGMLEGMLDYENY